MLAGSTTTFACPVGGGALRTCGEVRTTAAANPDAVRMVAPSRFEQELRTARRPARAAVLVGSGVGRGSLRGPAWRKVGHGLYTSAVERVTVTQRIADAAGSLTAEAAVGGWAAAYAWGVDVLDGTDARTGNVQPVDCVSGQLRRRSTPGIRYHRSALADDETAVRLGLRVTSPIRTALDGARWAASPEEAVVFLDAMVATLISIDDLRAAVPRHRNRAGIGQAIRAIDLVEYGVRSPWESRLRVCYRHDAGLPRPWVNVPIFSVSEDFMGIADLFDPFAGLITEFDGDQHRDHRHHHQDNIREEGFESANLTVVRTDRLDLNIVTNPDRRGVVRRLQDGYRRGCARDVGRDRWTVIVPEWWRGRIPGCDV